MELLNIQQSLKLATFALIMIMSVGVIYVTEKVFSWRKNKETPKEVAQTIILTFDYLFVLKCLLRNFIQDFVRLDNEKEILNTEYKIEETNFTAFLDIKFCKNQEFNLKVIFISNGVGTLTIPITLMPKRFKTEKIVMTIPFKVDAKVWVFTIPQMLLMQDIDFNLITKNIK